MSANFEKTTATLASADAGEARVQLMLEMARSVALGLLRVWNERRIDARAIDHAAQTDDDVLAAKTMRAWLADSAHTAGDLVLTEEDAHQTPTTAQTPEGFIWLIDPIDNTKAFQAGEDDFAVGITLLRGDGAPVAALLVLPARDDWFLAVAGRGAWHNGAALACPGGGERAIVRRPRAGASAAATGAYDAVQSAWHARGLTIEGGRALTALDILDLATPDGPAAFAYHAKPWDVLPALLIAHEAGARVHWLIDGQTLPGFPVPAAVMAAAATGSRAFCRAERGIALRTLSQIPIPSP